MKVPAFEMPLEEIRASLDKLRRPLSIAVLRARNPFNVGAIIRVAHSFLVREIILVGSERYYERGAMYTPCCSRQALPASRWVACRTQKNTAIAPSGSSRRRRSANRL